jgi:hypothetical protein
MCRRLNWTTVINCYEFLDNEQSLYKSKLSLIELVKLSLILLIRSTFASTNQFRLLLTCYSISKLIKLQFLMAPTEESTIIFFIYDTVFKHILFTLKPTVIHNKMNILPHTENFHSLKKYLKLKIHEKIPRQKEKR